MMKQGRIVGIALCLGCLLGGNSHAAAIGMPQPSARIGLAVGVANMTVKDTESGTASEWVARPLNLIYTDLLFLSNYRYWAEAFYQDAVLPAATHQLGQRVKQLGARLSLQAPLPFFTTIDSWLGAGLQLSSDRYDRRHNLDADGYLAQQFPDRSEIGAALLLNFVAEKNLGGLRVGVKAEQVIALGDGVSESTLALFLLFDF